MSLLQEEFLQDMASLLSHVEHRLFADYHRDISLSAQKSAYLEEYGISARQFNAIRINLEGKIKSCLVVLQDSYLEDLGLKINQRKKEIKKLEGLKNKSEKKLVALYHKKESLVRLTKKYERLKEDKKNKKARLCFGSRKLFRKQFDLKKNNYQSHEEWLSDWQKARANQFYLIGSKDENMGNQSCITTINADDTMNFKMKVPKALENKYGPYVTFTEIKLNYGKEDVFAALFENIKRSQLQSKQGKADHGDTYKQHGQALNFRFLCDEQGWRVLITVNKQPAKEKASCRDLGAIGIDINHDHLALAEINHTGNLVAAQTIPLNTYGKSHEQAQALIGDAIKAVVALALKKNKPLIIEELDFTQKKRMLERESKKTARMLSSFSYAAIKKMLQSRAFRYGIEIFTVNPAYSSVIGRVKFSPIYNISVHLAAALVIARRHYGFSESLPRSWKNIPDNTGGHIDLPQLAKIAGKHLWSSWAKVLKNLQVALAVRYQMFLQAQSSSRMTGNILEDLPDIPF